MSTQHPSYRAYTVIKREGQDDFWQSLGAAFPHQDGKGFNLKLSLLPLDGSDIVVREPRSEELRNQTVFAEPQDAA